MFEFLVERGRVVQVVELAVNFYALEAFFQQFRKLLAILAFATAYNGGEQVEACAFFQRHDAVYHLGDSLALDRQAGCGRIGNPDACPEEAHIVVNLCDRTHG